MQRIEETRLVRHILREAYARVHECLGACLRTHAHANTASACVCARARVPVGGGPVWERAPNRRWTQRLRRPVQVDARRSAGPGHRTKIMHPMDHVTTEHERYLSIPRG